MRPIFEWLVWTEQSVRGGITSVWQNHKQIKLPTLPSFPPPNNHTHTHTRENPNLCQAPSQRVVKPGALMSRWWLCLAVWFKSSKMISLYPQDCIVYADNSNTDILRHRANTFGKHELRSALEGLKYLHSQEVAHGAIRGGLPGRLSMPEKYRNWYSR